MTSCGTGHWHVGDSADLRARTGLTSAGYDDDHTAAQLGPEHLGADLLLAMDSGRLRALDEQGVGERARLVAASTATPMGPMSPTRTTDRTTVSPPFNQQIEAAVPGLLAWVCERR